MGKSVNSCDMRRTFVDATMDITDNDQSSLVAMSW